MSRQTGHIDFAKWLKLVGLSLGTLVISICQSQVQGYDNIVVDYSKESVVENDKLVTTNSYVFQVNNKDGDWITEIEIPYSEGQKVEGLEAWITDKLGNVVRKLKKKDIVDKSAIGQGSLYEDDFVKSFELKHTSYPYQVHYTYSIEYAEFILISYWLPVLFRNTPTLKASLKVDVPFGKKLNILQSSCNEPKLVQNDDRMVYQWTEQELLPVSHEVFAPHPLERYPRVLIAPADFSYGVGGSMSSWEAYGDWQCKLKSGLDILPPDVVGTVKQLTENLDQDEDKIRVLYHYLQDNTRYINVAIDIGGLKPYPALYVAERQYGDCKALSNYMQALLKVVGLESLYVNIYAGRVPLSLDITFPGPQFNHVVIAVPLEQDTIWLETTSGISPFGYLGTFTQNRFGLAVSEEGSRLVRTPALSPDEVLESRILEYSYKEGTSWELSCEETLRGTAFEEWNHYEVIYSSEDKKEAIDERVPYKVYELTDWQIYPKNRDDREITINYTVSLHELERVYDGNRIIQVQAFRLPKFEKPVDRENPVRIYYPISKKDSLIYKIENVNPELVSVPANDTLISEFGQYTVLTTIDDGLITLVKTFVLYAGKYDLESYGSLHQFISSVKKKDRKNAIIIKPKQL